MSEENPSIYAIEQTLQIKLKEGFRHDDNYYTCDENYKITGLFLYNLNLENPDALNQLFNAQFLVYFNQLSVLSFKKCQVSLSLLSPIAHYIKHLSFEDTEIEDHHVFASFEQLEVLSIHKWREDDDLKLLDLKDLLPIKYQLKKIDVFDSFILNHQLLKEFTSLEEIDTTINSLELARHVLRFNALKKLEIDIVDIKPSLKKEVVLDLKALKNVEYLSLKTDDYIKFKGVEHLKSLKKLELFFECNMKGLGNLKNLEYMEVSSDVNINEIPQIESLKTLILDLDENFEVHSLEQFPNLERLEIDAPVSQLVNLGTLNELKILRISELGAERTSLFNSLPNLEFLKLNLPESSLIENFDKLTNLIYLDLKFNYLENIEGLEYLKNLKYINLAENSISDIRVLNKLPKLKLVNLDGTHVTKKDAEQQLKNPEIAQWLSYQLNRWSSYVSHHEDYIDYSLNEFLYL